MTGTGSKNIPPESDSALTDAEAFSSHPLYPEIVGAFLPPFAGWLTRQHYLTMSNTRLSLHSMAPAHDPQLLKGVLSLLLLHLLAEQESYGYEVVQRLQAEGLTDVLEGTVYPALARLEREGRVAARLISSSSGPARKYYRPTASGYAALAAGTATWARQTEIVAVILTRPLPAHAGPGNPT